MQQRTAASVPSPHDVVKTLPFRREEITTKFIREPVDADDTVPVELYSQPYERLELQPDSSPYEKIEIERPDDNLAADVTGDPPINWLRVLVAVSILCFAFSLGVGFAFVAL